MPRNAEFQQAYSPTNHGFTFQGEHRYDESDKPFGTRSDNENNYKYEVLRQKRRGGVN